MSKFWMNVSSSERWSGGPVGIIRVETELRRRLLTEEVVITNSGFTKLRDLLPFESKLLAPKNKSKLENKATAFIHSALSISPKARFRRGVAYLVSALYGWNSYFDVLLNWSINISVNLGSRIYLYLKKYSEFSHQILTAKSEQNHSHSDSYKKKIHPFSEGDVIFTCGLDWDYAIFESLSEIKKDVGIKIVSVVYDLIPIRNPEFVQNRHHVNKLLGHFSLLAASSDLILVNTLHTKNNLEIFIAELGLKLPDIKVVPWGVSFDLNQKSTEVVELDGKIEDVGFILAVGTLEVRKNYQLLLNIVRLAEEQDVEIPHFVFVGQAGWGTHDLTIILNTDENLSGRITWLQTATDGELQWLYENASAFLSPSFDEGFGLPVAEAQMFGKQILLSDISVYRELFPDAKFLSPNDPAAWLDSLKELSSSNQSFKIPLTWDIAAAKIVEAIHDSLGTKVNFTRSKN